MRETEAKARLKNAQELIRQLESKGCVLSGPFEQHDSIFLPKEIHLDSVPIGVGVLRVRRQGDEIILNVKRHLSNELDCEEHEVRVSDFQQTVALILNIGYEQVIQVRKQRRTTTLGRFNLCIDSVDDLGDFIEIELDSSAEFVTSTQDQLFSVLETLGVNIRDRVELGYDHLLWLKRHLEK